MTKEQYLRILLISGRDWFNWHDVPYGVKEFDEWHDAKLIQFDGNRSLPDQWKLTALAREVHGVKND